MSYRRSIWQFIRPVARPVGAWMIVALFHLLWVFPVKKNKVVACVSAGRRYDDNQKYIMEELHKLRPDADIVWIINPRYPYDPPGATVSSGIKVIRENECDMMGFCSSCRLFCAIIERKLRRKDGIPSDYC